MVYACVCQFRKRCVRSTRYCIIKKTPHIVMNDYETLVLFVVMLMPNTDNEPDRCCVRLVHTHIHTYIHAVYDLT